MKIEWEADDIRPGRMVGRPGRNERWMIGYIIQEKEVPYCLISVQDGMVVKLGSAESAAEHLNASGDVPI